MKSNNTSPKIAQRFLLWFLKDELAEEILGDLEEKFYTALGKTTPFKAKLIYWYQVFNYLRPFAIGNRKSTNSNHYAMFQSYFKIGYRNLVRHKVYSIINIAGLTLGMSVAILISIWIWDEITFNKGHGNYNTIARVMQNQNFNGEIQTWRSQAIQLGPELQNSFGSHFKNISMANFPGNHTLLFDKKALTRKGIFMEPQAPDMLTLKMLSGSRSGLIDPYSILLSESTAIAFFSDVDPINKVIRLNNESDVKVTGVYKDLPHNSTFAGIQFVAPWDLYTQGLPDWLGWGNSWFQTYVQIEENADITQISSLIKDVKLNNGGEDNGLMKPQLFLHPMSKWHLQSEFKQGINTGGRIQYVWLYGIIGVFVLLLACINFMNLSTARSEKRAKEVGIRKAIGSYRGQLIGQFMSESILVSILAFGLALLLVGLILPSFNEVAGKEINMFWSNPFFWLVGIGFVLLTGMLAGSYPAFYLSSFKVVKALKGSVRIGKYSAIPRKILVIIQFTVSISLIISTLLVFQQIQFSKDRQIGYSYNDLISIPIKSDKIHEHYNTFRNELLQTGAIMEVSKSASPITNMGTTNSGLEWNGKDPDMQDEFVTLRITHEFGKTVGWEIMQGRDFSKDFVSDSMGLVINEKAVAYMGLKNPVGETVKWGDNGTYTILGVVKNMVTQSPYEPIKQMIFFIDYTRSNFANIKLNPGSNANEALAKIESVFKKYDPVSTFDYQFADTEYAKKFGNEERIGKLASFFAIIAVLISCLGLFGMASYVAEQRTKEIGVRKVLGASVNNILKMFSKDFIVLVLISFFIAIPITYFFMNKWLLNYEYHTQINWWIFAITGLGTLIITLITVSYQALKAALTNPVISLKAE